ncbi:MAG: BatA domain-containing protein [Gemmataceae bacterium]|nr:BatA domain-containing protein [Gemmataceae bacterium]
MGFGFLNAAVLAGLAAVAIPILIHLLHRRRFQTIDWGAMQFLKLSQTTRRRLWLEELLLLLLRIGLIAVLVLGLAGPYATGLGGVARPSRDVVLVLDATASMSVLQKEKDCPLDVARDWIDSFLRAMQPGDRVAFLLARQPPSWVQDHLTQDADLVRDGLDALPTPGGVPDWPAAFDAALGLLEREGANPQREIVVVSDNQRFGWADPETMRRWEKMSSRFRSEKGSAALPRVWHKNIAREGIADLPNEGLSPLHTSRTLAWVGQTVKFTSALRWDRAQERSLPHRLFFEVDGKHAGDIALPTVNDSGGQVVFNFQHRFAVPGSHLVSLVLEPDPPKDRWPAGYRARDAYPADNRQDLVLEVAQALPVLVIDGGPLNPAHSPPQGRGAKSGVQQIESPSYFLEKALAGPADGQRPALAIPRVLAYSDWSKGDLVQSEKLSQPRVVIFADVPRLSSDQSKAIEQYLAGGGAVLMFLGPRSARESQHYNDDLFRLGAGWLPARLEKIAGDAERTELWASPDPKRQQHPTLAIFESTGGLGHVRFPRWLRLAVAAKDPATTPALLTSGDPFLVERIYKSGRVMLCAVPPDRSWGSGFPSQWEFPVLLHELVFHLANTHSARNLAAGQPIRLQGPLTPNSSPPQGRGEFEGKQWLLTPPSGQSLAQRIDSWPWTWADTGEVGPYRLQSSEGATIYFAVEGDAREADLILCTKEERGRVAQFLSIRELKENLPVETAENATSTRQDLWWIFLVGVTLLLCGEVWWTRRMALRRSG